MGVSGKVKSQPALFLDRDGVVNKAVVRNGQPYPPASIDDLELVEGIQDLIAEVKNQGFKIFIFTNQPDVARGTARKEKIVEIHDYLSGKLGIDKIYCCLHDDDDNCDCRKPKPGMLFQAKAEWSLDFDRSFVIGDRWRDIAAARAANIKSILLDYHYNEKKEIPDYSCVTLREALLIIKNQLNND